VHLKDVKDKTRFTILGQGDLRVADFLRELLRFGYSQPISLEHEENPQNPMADLRACLEAARSAIALVR
jgi:sugar phosphate isomerase/epimerase